MILFEEVPVLRKFWRIVWVIALLAGLLLPGFAWAAGENNDTVYIITIDGDIDKALVSVVESGFTAAQQAGAERVIIEIDTYGGYVDSAIAIKDQILNSSIPVTCYVNSKAISAGSLIALAGNELFMAPGSVIGAAEPRVGNEKADEKSLSMWAAELAATAEARGRDGKIASAMADSSVVIPQLSEEGKLLTLTDTQAAELGLSDGSYAGQTAILEHYGLSDANVLVNEPTFQQKIGRFLTNPVVAPILLAIGIIGLVLEIFTAGFGAFGILGIVGLLLYFGGGIMAGYAGWVSALLFVGGLVLIALEIFVVPGFGITGIAGIAALVAGVVAVAPSWEQALISLAVAIVVSIAVVAWSIKYKKTRKMWSRLILWGKQEKETGYTSAQAGLETLIGAQGVALTPLRPAGTAQINDRRVDVVTEGDFIDAQTPIVVIHVEGVRVVVKALS